MRIRGRWLPIIVAFLVLTLGAVVAYADSINADGDILKPGNNLNYTDSANFTQHCSTRGTPAAGVATVKFNGNGTHFQADGTVTITLTPDAAGAAAGITATGGAGTVPNPWNTNQQTFTIPISTTVPVTAPNGTYVITADASGPANDAHGNPLTFHTSDTYTVSVACSNAPPTISWTSNPSSANEGDLETYAFSISDPDSTSWGFASGSPSCGANGSISGTPSIDSSARTGTFTCSFPNGPATSTVSVAVSDGASSNVLTQAVSIANVAPTVSFTAAPPTAFEGETKTFAFAVSDPGVSDTYAAASGYPSCGSGGTYVSGSLAVTGNHGSQTGSFACSFPSITSTTVAIAFTDSDGATGTPATTLVTVQDAPLTAGALTITNGVESLTASQLTFGFTDANPAGAVGDYTATIDWGDSTTSAGTVSPGFTVHGSHTYAEEGNYSVTVTVSDVGGSTTSATGQAVVADAPLTGGTLTIGDGVAGVTAAPLSFGFTDANPAATASDFTATIDWGDSTTSAGTVTSVVGGGFTAQASHTYSHAGTFTVTVTVTDAGGSTTSATGHTTVTSAPLVAGTLTITTGVEGVTPAQLDFGFTDPNPAGTAADYTATIDWGDSTSSAGTVTAKTGGGFDASASHTYADEGTYTVSVIVTSSGGSTASASGHTSVSDASLTAGTVAVGSGVAGVTAAPLSFSFTDANPGAPVSDFTATINWGDSTTSAGTISASGSGFAVQGSHTYAHAGSFTVTITVNDVGGSTASATGTATITSAPLTAGTLTITTGVEGVTPAQLTFGFTDGNPFATAADYTATVDWGDSTTSAGTVSAVVGGGFTVHASHTYADEGTDAVVVTVTNTGGSTTSAAGHATIADAPLTAGTLTIGAGVAGVTAAPLSFSFTDANPGAPLSDFTATINWGDSTTSAGTVSASGSGFSVAGSHTYAHAGSFTVTVTVNDVGGSTISATGHATVTSAPLTAGTLTITTGVEGVTPAQLTFGFTDGNPAATAADYTATINWGDTTSSAGTVTTGSGGFTVNASHAYADEGTKTVVVTVTSSGGSTTTATGHTTIADAPLTAGTLSVTGGVQATTPAQLTFGFSDANPAAPVTDFTATINWGDSTTSAGTITTASGGGLTVQGSHTYATSGTFTVTVTVTDVGGSTATATGHATVAKSPLTAGTLTIGNGVEGLTAAQLTFGFTSANPLATAADFTATIRWGDRTSSAGTVTAAAGGGFTVSGSHLYSEEDTYEVKVTVTDTSGNSTSAEGHARIADAALNATAPTLPPDTNPFLGTTATFTDANPVARLDDFLAKIDWGDGDRSFGLVTRSAGGFTVHGAHWYEHTGYYTIKTKIFDDGGSTASASTQVLIFSFPRRGAFVIGDQSATGSVTFWSNQWWKKNSLSGGPAPSSFKGFASDPRNPTCHARWTAGSNDDAPDEDLPDYMAVIVSSSITRSGSRITGDTAHMVIVRTGPGDRNDHGHTGTGTVVASVPGC